MCLCMWDLVPGAALEGLLSDKSREHGLGQRPRVVKVVQQLFFNRETGCEHIFPVMRQVVSHE